MREGYEEPLIAAESFDEPEEQHVGPDAVLHRFADSTEVNPSELSNQQRQDIIDSFHDSAEVKEYLTRPNSAEALLKLIDYLGEKCEEEGMSENERRSVTDQARELLDEVFEFCHRYTGMVRKMQHLKDKGRFRMDEREYAEERSKMDRDRRLTHEALFSAMKSFNEYMSITVYKQYHIDIPAQTLFDDSLFLDRGKGGAWAVRTNYYLRAKHLVDDIKKGVES